MISLGRWRMFPSFEESPQNDSCRIGDDPEKSDEEHEEEDEPVPDQRDHRAEARIRQRLTGITEGEENACDERKANPQYRGTYRSHR